MAKSFKNHLTLCNDKYCDPSIMLQIWALVNLRIAIKILNTQNNLKLHPLDYRKLCCYDLHRLLYELNWLNPISENNLKLSKLISHVLSNEIQFQTSRIIISLKSISNRAGKFNYVSIILGTLWRSPKRVVFEWGQSADRRFPWL